MSRGNLNRYSSKMLKHIDSPDKKFYDDDYFMDEQMLMELDIQFSNSASKIPKGSMLESPSQNKLQVPTMIKN